MSETGRYTQEIGFVTPLERMPALKPGGFGLVRGAHPARCQGQGNFRLGLFRLGLEATVKVYGVAVAMPQG